MENVIEVEADVIPPDSKPDAPLDLLPRDTALGAWTQKQTFKPHQDMTVDIFPDANTRIAATPAMVRELLHPNIPEKDAMRFLFLCRSACLHPFGGEVFITTRENERGGRDYQFIIAKQAWRRLACQHRDFRGYTVDVFPFDKTKYQKPVVAVAKVWRKDCPEPYTIEVFYDEATNEIGKGGAIRKKTGFAETQPREWLRGVATARAFRHTFPDQFSGFYSEEELGS